MQKAARQLAMGVCSIATACFMLGSACQSTRPQPSAEGGQGSAQPEAKVEHLSEEPLLLAAPVASQPVPPAAPPAMAAPALLRAAGAPRAASLTQAEAHSFIRLKTSIERANAAAQKKKGRSP